MMTMVIVMIATMVVMTMVKAVMVAMTMVMVLSCILFVVFMMFIIAVVIPPRFVLDVEARLLTKCYYVCMHVCHDGDDYHGDRTDNGGDNYGDSDDVFTTDDYGDGNDGGNDYSDGSFKFQVSSLFVSIIIYKMQKIVK